MRPAHWRQSLVHALEAWILPTGLLALFTGILWINSIDRYPSVLRFLIMPSALILLFACRNTWRQLVHTPVIAAFTAFAAYTLLSIAWSDSTTSLSSLLKRPFYVLLFLIAVVQVALAHPRRLENVVRLSTWVACILGTLEIALFLFNGSEGRLTGHGALTNPILTAHVFGFFLALAVASWIIEGSQGGPWKVIAIVLLSTIIVATGSRGGMIAAASAVFSAVLFANMRDGTCMRRSLFACGILLTVTAVTVALFPDILTQRGLSLRPQIWAVTLDEIVKHPWFGYGYESPVEIHIAGVAESYSDPHSIPLAVLRQAGIVGFALWLAIYIAAFVPAWRNRRDPAISICVVPLISGIVAGLTEGIAYLSRPEEHWFLIWIPLALLVGAFVAREQRTLHVRPSV